MAQLAPLVAVLFHERPMCLDCAAQKSGLSVVQAKQYLTIIGKAVQVLREDIESCRLCGQARPLFSLRRSAN